MVVNRTKYKVFDMKPLLRGWLEADMNVAMGKFHLSDYWEDVELTLEVVLQNLEGARMTSPEGHLGNLEVGSRVEDRAYLGPRKASEDEQVMVDPLIGRKHHMVASICLKLKKYAVCTHLVASYPYHDQRAFLVRGQLGAIRV